MKTNGTVHKVVNITKTVAKGDGGTLPLGAKQTQTDHLLTD